MSADEITLQSIARRLDTLSERVDACATKKDLEAFATKKDLEAFVTNESLDEKLKKFVTNDSLDEKLKKFVTNDSLDEKLNQLREDMRLERLELYATIRAEMRADGEKLRAELKAEMRAEMASHFGAMTEHLTAMFDVFAERIDRCLTRDEADRLYVRRADAPA